MNTTQSRRTFTNKDNDHSDHFLEKTEQKLQKAIMHHNQGSIAEAKDLYLNVLKTVPENPCANFNLAIIHHESGELRKAISCYKKVLVHDPENFQVLSNLADAYRDNGFPEQAAVTYQRALEFSPEHPHIHYNLGILYHQLKFTEESIENFEKTLAIEPEHFSTLYNLGTICFECGAYHKALDFYNRAHAIDPDDMDCCYNLGLTHFQLGNYSTSATCYELALTTAPEDASLHNTLGTVYRQLHEYQKAIHYYQKALALHPELGSAYTNLAIVLQILGDTSGAVRCFRQAVALGHEVESAEYMIAALTGSNRNSTPRSYIKNLFDSFAVNFDRKLVHELEYDVPAKLYAMHESLFQNNTQYNQVLDLGCGTGLAGEHFREFAETLTGVDLSEQMIAQAKQKNIYDHLYCDDIVDFLNSSASCFDLVLAADVMIYIGDLSPLFSAVSKKISPSGFLLFSSEGHDGKEFQLRQSGRYAYARKYIEQRAVENNFRIESAWSTNIRKEKNEWIPGCLFVLKNIS